MAEFVTSSLINRPSGIALNPAWAAAAAEAAFTRRWGHPLLAEAKGL